MTTRRAALSGFAWGVIGGLVVVGLMYLAAAFLGLRPLTQALNEPLLSVMPGFVFGFLIDTLQHAGKVVEEAGLIVVVVAALGGLGAAWSVMTLRHPFQYSALVFGAIGWAVVVLVLLPVAGLGPLGLNDGFATPIEWAVLFVAYGMVLEARNERPAGERVDLQRRRLLSAVPLGIGAAALGLTGVLRVPDWYRAIVNPPEAGLSGPSPAVTPVANFYVVSKNFSDPVVDGGAWKLSMGGLVDHPQSFALAQLRALPSVTQYVTLECISNNVGGPQMSTGSFTGVPLQQLLEMAGPSTGASWVSFKSVDGYTESLRLNEADRPGVLVAYDLGGSQLPTQHGYPARMVIPGHYGMKGPKWLQSIDLTDHETSGYWEQQGWDHNAGVKTTSRFDVPRDGVIYKLGAITLAGVAFSGTRGISRVEYSTDGGRSWNGATLMVPLSPYSWSLWNATWTPSSEGSYTLLVRATDGSGALQSSSNAASFPSGSSGYHTIRIDVSR